MNMKTCTKCGKELPATLEYFYKNSGGKFGLTPRCKPCVNIDNIESAKKRDPELVKAQASARSRKHYHNNLEKAREVARKSAQKIRSDPNRYKEVRARKRAGGAGLSHDEIEQIRTNQNNLCAICQDPDPTDLDHCHKSGEVRWLLCRHCNRGLGAFKDNPALLLKAALMMEHRSINKESK